MSRNRPITTWRVTVKSDEEEDVIDLGAPRKVRAARCRVPPARAPHAPRAYTPNPRLYPGPQKPQKRQVQITQKPKLSVPRNCKKTYRRPVPNSRLYQPQPPKPPKPPKPPARPSITWRPPAQGKLETASRAAFRLNQGLYRSPQPLAETITNEDHEPTERPVKKLALAKKYSTIKKRSPRRSSKLVVKLPAAAGDGNESTRSEPRPRYRPASRHFRDRDLGSCDSTPTGGRVIQLSFRGAMDAAPRHSASPEDCSEGNDPQSAPSEFLAEFLSAIMRRQYAEALKYCRLILQYEPRNATARGFYPLLQQKLAQSPREAGDKTSPRSRHQRCRVSRSPDLGGASSGANSGGSSPAPCVLPHEVMEQETDLLSCSEPRPGSAASERSEGEPGLGSVSSQSSLELDSSPAHSSPSLSLSRRTDSASASGTWDSSGSGALDDNGNPAPAHTSSPKSLCDAENNQPAASVAGRAAPAPLTLQSEQSTESLRRLRAQFTCSIK